MTKWVVLPSLSLIFAGIFLSQFPQSSYQYQMGDLGRMVKGHLGVLYDLRSKISSKVQSDTELEEDKNGDQQVQKESRDYSFHYSPSSVHLTQPNSFSVDSSTINSGSSGNKNRKKQNHADKNRVNKVTKKKSKSVLSVSVQPIMKGLAQSLNAVIAQKLMKTMDQEISSGILNPLKHLVSSGNRMVEFWDKRSNSKVPGVVEMLGIGLDELKRYKEGQPLKSGDPVSNLTSVSRTLAEGMVTVKKLTNRVLGYDPDEDGALEERGYGHDSYGHGHGHMSYGGGHSGLDPFSLLAALAFGAFLLQLLLTLLNTSSTRSLDVVDINVPLMTSDFYMPNMTNPIDRIFGTPTTRLRRNVREINNDYFVSENGVFGSVINKLSDFYKNYQRFSNRPECLKRYMCTMVVQDRDEGGSGFISQLTMFGFSQLMREELGSEFVQNLRTRLAKGDNVECEKFGDTECLDE